MSDTQERAEAPPEPSLEAAPDAPSEVALGWENALPEPRPGSDDVDSTGADDEHVADTPSTSDDEDTSGSGTSDDGTSNITTRSVRNQTPHRLVVTTATNEQIIFAPLEERTYSAAQLPTTALDDRGLLKAAETKKIKTAEILYQIGFGAAWVGFIGWVVIINIVDKHPEYEPWIWIGAGALLLIGIGTAYMVMAEQEPAVGRLVAQIVTLIFVLAISVGIPTATVWRFADEDFWSMSGLDVFVRLSQIAIISVAAMLPGLLFFFFDRQKLSTLRNRFERQIFRLDPNVMTLADVCARYGRQMEETYGTLEDGQSMRLARQRRLPILIGTIVLTLSWTIALAPVSSLPDDLQPGDIAQVLAPHADPVSFGFLGAYFYALNLVWRRYTRGDLRPKAYSAITVRILVVLVVTWVLAAVAPDDAPLVLVLSFLIGIVPETVFVLLREWFGRSRASRFALKALEEPQPLQDLAGMDLYDRARLLDEGISNVQALAHHDLVDLLLETRVPAGRLVDWVDQSVLYLHCRPAQRGGKPDRSATDKGAPAPRDMFDRLALVGIRTATDFEVAMDQRRRELLKHRTGKEATFDEPTLEILLTSMGDDEWLRYVRHWRQDRPVRELRVTIAADGSIVGEPTEHPIPSDDDQA